MTVVEEKINEMLDEPCWESKPYLIGMDKIGVADVMERFAEWDEQRIVGRAVEWLEKYLFYLDKRDDVVENFKQYVKEGGIMTRDEQKIVVQRPYEPFYEQ